VYVRLDDAFLEQDLQQTFFLLAAVQDEGHVGAFGHPRQHPQHALLLGHAHVVGEVVFVQPAFSHCNDLSAAREGLDVRHLGLDVEPRRWGERVRPRLRRDDVARRIQGVDPARRHEVRVPGAQVHHGPVGHRVQPVDDDVVQAVFPAFDGDGVLLAFKLLVNQVRVRVNVTS